MSRGGDHPWPPPFSNCTGRRDCRCLGCRHKIDADSGSFGVRGEAKPAGLMPRHPDRRSHRLNKLVQPLGNNLPKEVYSLRGLLYSGGRNFRLNIPGELPGNFFLRARAWANEGFPVESGGCEAEVSGIWFDPFLEGITTQRDLMEMREIIDHWERENGQVIKSKANTYFYRMPIAEQNRVMENTSTPGWALRRILRYLDDDEDLLPLRTGVRDIGEMTRIIWFYMWCSGRP